jgi:hypothetical protein
VIYFFAKEAEYIKFEIYPGRPHVLTIIADGANPQTERYSTSADLHDRLNHLWCDLKGEGWDGPLGRDARA